MSCNQCCFVPGPTDFTLFSLTFGCQSGDDIARLGVLAWPSHEVWLLGMTATLMPLTAWTAWTQRRRTSHQKLIKSMRTPPQCAEEWKKKTIRKALEKWKVSYSSGTEKYFFGSAPHEAFAYKKKNEENEFHTRRRMLNSDQDHVQCLYKYVWRVCVRLGKWSWERDSCSVWWVMLCSLCSPHTKLTTHGMALSRTVLSYSVTRALSPSLSCLLRAAATLGQ